MKAFFFAFLFSLSADATTLLICDAELPDGTAVGRISVRLDPPLASLEKPNGAREILMDENFVYVPQRVALAQSRIQREGDESNGYMRWSQSLGANGSLHIHGAFLRGSFFSSYRSIGVPKIVEYRFDGCDPQ